MISNQDHQAEDKGVLLKTTEEYANTCTIHGIAYCFGRGKLNIDRILWLIIVLAATAFAAYSNFVVLQDTDPILTTVETAALPIEEVRFPSITICPQGSVNEIIDAAFSKQFEDYLKTKGLHLSREKRDNAKHGPPLAFSEIQEEGTNFLLAKYPGAKALPLEMVQILGSPELDPDKYIRNEAILNFEDDNTRCKLTGYPLARVSLSTQKGQRVCVGSMGNVYWGSNCTEDRLQVLVLEMVHGVDNHGFALKSHLGTYFTVGMDNNFIYANSFEIGKAEIFTMNSVDNYSYSFKSQRNGLFISTANNTEGRLNLVSNFEGIWESFEVTDKTKGGI